MVNETQDKKEEVFTFFSKCVGSTFTEGGQDILKALEVGQVLHLKHDVGNQYDSNAVGIHLKSEMNSTRFAYIPKETAAKLISDVQANQVSCKVAELTGNTEGKSNAGANIELTVTRPIKEVRQ